MEDNREQLLNSILSVFNNELSKSQKNYSANKYINVEASDAGFQITLSDEIYKAIPDMSKDKLNDLIYASIDYWKGFNGIDAETKEYYEY